MKAFIAVMGLLQGVYMVLFVILFNLYSSLPPEWLKKDVEKMDQKLDHLLETVIEKLPNHPHGPVGARNDSTTDIELCLRVDSMPGHSWDD